MYRCDNVAALTNAPSVSQPTQTLGLKVPSQGTGLGGISDGQTFASNRDEFLLAKYPYLRKAINARRNINRFFRELEFFSHIPSTCERLRDDLHGGEWTDEEWSTIRNVSMEHVELEVIPMRVEQRAIGREPVVAPIRLEPGFIVPTVFLAVSLRAGGRGRVETAGLEAPTERQVDIR